MKSILKRFGVASAIVVFAVAPALAITWTFVEQAIIEDNQGNPTQITISGAFDYDSDTNIATNISIIVENAETFSGTFDELSFVEQKGGTDDTTFVFSPDGSALGDGLGVALLLEFSSPLTNSGLDPGVQLTLKSAKLGTCKSYNDVSGECISVNTEAGNGTGANLVSGGLITDVATIPAPAPAVLLLSGLIGLGVLRFRKRRQRPTTAFAST